MQDHYSSVSGAEVWQGLGRMLVLVGVRGGEGSVRLTGSAPRKERRTLREALANLKDFR
jgi:hypothetical protein